MLLMIIMVLAIFAIQGTAFNSFLFTSSTPPSSRLRLSTTSSPLSTPPPPPPPPIPTTTIIKPDFRLCSLFSLVGLDILITPILANSERYNILLNGGPGFLLLSFGVFLGFQARRVRFVFDETTMSLRNKQDPFDDLDPDYETVAMFESSGENIVVGGVNSWSYSSFTNWDFFPNVNYPILIYFKENLTSPAGQQHFFPAICNAKQIENELYNRGCSYVGDR